MKETYLISRQAAIEALEQIRYALWEIDIPSPTVPEYIEHHEGVQSVMKRIDEIREKMEQLPSAQPERKKGEWVNARDGYDGHVKCNKCFKTYDWTSDAQYFNFCPNCGADMRGGENG